jgi:hypothetical protein
MRIVSFFVAFFFVVHNSVCSQSSLTIQFVPFWKGVQILSDYPITSEPHVDSLHLSTLCFYLHGVELSDQGNQVWTSGNNHFLIDALKDSRFSVELPLPEYLKYDELSFVVGVDSSLQLNGAHSGVLDPMEGMYWTWQSGYIHWKLEADAKIGGKREEITWHVGGYRHPFNTLRRVSIPVVSGDARMKIGIDVFSLLADGQSDVDYTIMSPSKQAMHLADQFQNAFRWLAE